MTARFSTLPTLTAGLGQKCAVLDEFVSTERRNVLSWLFEDRRTGRIVVAQWPNIPLRVWIVTSAVNWLVDPGGRWGSALSVTGTVALAVWAADEIVRGVNPGRRVLGAAVLGSVVVGVLIAFA
jgi:hypothetical protein